MVKHDNWFEDFATRCIAEGIDPDGLLLSTGYDDREIRAYKRGNQVSLTDRVLLESALLDWGTEPDPEEELEEVVDEIPEAPAPDPPVICDGDKIRCPYLTLTGRKGCCMLPRCMYRRENVDDQTRADAGQEPAP